MSFGNIPAMGWGRFSGCVNIYLEIISPREGGGGQLPINIPLGTIILDRRYASKGGGVGLQ